MDDQQALSRLIRAVALDSATQVAELLANAPSAATATLEKGATRTEAREHFIDEIGHYVYAGDTALHVAAAGHRPEIARMLLSAGADVAARNRRGAQPLHYAADGHPGWDRWDPDAQAAIITILIQAGADPNAFDKSGVAPLHRAVRTRSAAAVSALLAGGADPRIENKNGSSPLKLANLTTGRGGTGSPEAREQQQAILLLLERHGAKP